MKQVIETKLVEQTTVKYVAEDGKIFEGENAEGECVVYERQKNREKCEREFLKLNPLFIRDIFVEYLWGFDYSICTVVLVNEGDFIVAEDYYRATSPSWCDFASFTKPQQFPAQVVIVANENFVEIAGDPLSVYVDQVKQMLDKMQEQGVMDK